MNWNRWITAAMVLAVLLLLSMRVLSVSLDRFIVRCPQCGNDIVVQQVKIDRR